MARLHEFKRVIGVTQVLYLIGRWLKRRGIRYTALAVLICGSAIIVDIAGTGTGVLEEGLGWEQKISMAIIPGAVALFTLGLGSFLTCICSLFSSERILIADANSMNLMEDRKKADMGWHLDVLWDRVFKYEAKKQNDWRRDAEATEVGYNLGESTRDLGCWRREQFGSFGDKEDDSADCPAYSETVRETTLMTRDEFLAAAHWALARSSPQKYEEHVTGCNFSLIEDWYDGAFFTSDDRKLQDQFSAHKAIRGIRQFMGIPWSVKVIETLFGHPPPLWHFLTMKKIGTSVGTLISKMNREYCGFGQPYFFDAQDFLWDGQWFAAVALKTFGDRGEDVIEDVLKCRRKMFRTIFSHDRQTAYEHIYRMFGQDYVNAMNLRLDYDIEYAAGMLDSTPSHDVRELSEVMLREVFPEKTVVVKVQRARLMLCKADDFLTTYLPNVFANPSALRVARVGFFVNQHGIQEKIATDPTAATSLFQEAIIASDRRYVSRVCLLRQHYELTRLQLLSYVGMVDDLAQYELISEPESSSRQTEVHHSREVSRNTSVLGVVVQNALLYFHKRTNAVKGSKDGRRESEQ